jgi:hypothetical protein
MLLNGTTVAGKYGITLNGSDSYGSGDAWDKQPGYPVRSVATGGDQYTTCLPLVVNFGPFPAYHLFAPDSKTLYCELEVATNQFIRLGFGSLDLFNPSSPGGGRFFYATTAAHVTSSTGAGAWLGSPTDTSGTPENVPFHGAAFSSQKIGSASAVRCLVAPTNNWAGSGYAASVVEPNLACQGGAVHDDAIIISSPNPLNSVGILVPITVSVNNANTYLHPLGTVPGIRYMDMTLYQPAEEFTLGSDTWKVFPWYQKGGISSQRGIAYLKN